MWSTMGHNHNKQYFEKAIKNSQFTHAYLFSGPEMIGKKMFAYDLAKMLNGRDSQNDPDFKLVGLKIEDMRELKSFLSKKSYFGQYQIAVIDNADQLTTEASNAVLKTLEEPSRSTILILVTSRPKSLLPTILSRCQEVRFQLLSKEDIIGLISQKIKTDDKNFLIHLAGGRPGWLIRNVDNLEKIKTSIKEFNQVIGQGVFEKFQYAAKIYDQEDCQEIVSNLIYWYYPQDQKSPKLLRSLSQLSNIISQPQYNKRLAIENFLINL